MEHIEIDDIDHVEHPAHVNSVRKPVSSVLGTTAFALMYNELAPGEAFSGALHTHHDQEEIFYILEGTATFEVGRDRDQIEVREQEIIRFAPGEFQRGFNESSSRVIALIFSAPGAEHDWTEEELRIECRECEAETSHSIATVEVGSWQADTLDLRMTCRECGNSYTTANITD
jgi:mannose-6-phosphate isomerase-like protein (cupin superfamily)